MADEMDRTGIQLAQEGSKIGGMSRRRVVLPCIGLCGSAVIARSVSNEAVLLRNSLTLWLPEAEVEEGAVRKHDWSACTLIEVGEIDAIHMQLPRLQGFSSPRL
jgi:hypothetical protein